MKGKVFYSDHVPYICRNSEKKNYSLVWVNKNFRSSTIQTITFKSHYGWMIKDGHLYDLRQEYTDAGFFGPYKYNQITEAANDLFQGVDDVTENEKIIIVESKNVPDMMQIPEVHHYIPMFDGCAYSLNDNDSSRLECWRIVDEVEIEKNETSEVPDIFSNVIEECRKKADDILRHPAIIQQPIRLDRVVYNDPATVVFWSDGTKTVVKCSPKDTYDPEKGLLLCIAKKFSGNGEDWYKKIQEKLPKTKSELKPTAIHDKKLTIDCDIPLRNVPALCTLIAKKIKYGYNRFEFKGAYATDVLKRIIALADSQK